MALALRQAEAADASAIAEIHALSFDEPWSAESIAVLMTGPGGYGVVARRDGEDVGFALFHCVPPESELLSVGVRPHLRRNGIAQAILRRAAADLAQRGAITMFLDVAADNHAAMALYRALGFRDISRRPRYYRGKVDAILMQAELSGIVA